jgi:hypothetical protein
LGGQQIGFASNRVDTLPDSIKVEDLMILEIPALGTIHRVEARTEAALTRTLSLRSFQASLRGDDVRFGAKGVVSGDSLLEVEIETGDSRQFIDVRLEREIVLPALLPLHLVFGTEPEVGETYAVRLFDPLLLEERDVDVTILAESTLVVPDSAALDETTGLWVPARWDTLQAWHLAQQMGGMSVEAWIDELGQVVRATSPAGFSMERTAFEIAFDNFQAREMSASQLEVGLGRDIIRLTAIASNVALETGNLEELTVLLGGVSLSGFDLSGGRQTLIGDTLVIRRETDEQLSADPDRHSPEVVSKVGTYLQPDPMIQSRDPRMQAQVRQIVGRRRDPVRVARLINEWVECG